MTTRPVLKRWIPWLAPVPALLLALPGCGGRPIGATVQARDASGAEERLTGDARPDRDARPVADAQPRCGNGVAEPGEACDGLDLRGQTCWSLGLGSGELGCTPDCALDRQGCAYPHCGNGHIDPPEVCDGPDLGGLGCEDLGLYPGSLACMPGCSGLDPSACGGFCGDGQVSGPEVCEGQDFGGDSCQARSYYYGTLLCDASCQAIDASGCYGFCGDGQVSGPEVCEGQDLGGDSCQAHGYYHGTLTCDASCLAIDLSGCSGFCGDGTCDQPEGETPFTCPDCPGYVQISADYINTCAIASDTTAWCWGKGREFLGDGATTHQDCDHGDCSPVPVQVAGLADVASVDVGYQHSCAVRSDGTAWCWGWAWWFSFASTGDASAPVQMSGLADVATISAGWGHTCIVLSDRTAWCWGFDHHGQLGNGVPLGWSAPVQVTGLADVATISAGRLHTCAVLSAGAPWCWGADDYGQLGDGPASQLCDLNPFDTGPCSPVPVQPDGLAGAAAISAGERSTCAVLSDGTVWCWGLNASGQLGDGTQQDSDVPVQVTGLSSAVYVAVGSGHSCALLADGTVWCWGAASGGALGNGVTGGYFPTPVQVVGLTNAVAVSAGYGYTCAVLSDGTAWCWGWNDVGQLGNGSLESSSVPVQAIPPP